MFLGKGALKICSKFTGRNLKFSNSVAKGLKLKVRKFVGLIPSFVEVTGGKLVSGRGVRGGGEGYFLPLPSPCPPIVNRVKRIWKYKTSYGIIF